MATQWHYNPKVNEVIQSFADDGAQIKKHTEHEFTIKKNNMVIKVNASRYNETKKIQYTFGKTGAYAFTLRVVKGVVLVRLLYGLYKSFFGLGKPVPEDKARREEYFANQRLQQQSNNLALTGLFGGLFK